MLFLIDETFSPAVCRHSLLLHSRYGIEGTRRWTPCKLIDVQLTELQ
jgi:hypothetical protein